MQIQTSMLAMVKEKEVVTEGHLTQRDQEDVWNIYKKMRYGQIWISKLYGVTRYRIQAIVYGRQRAEGYDMLQ